MRLSYSAVMSVSREAGLLSLAPWRWDWIVGSDASSATAGSSIVRVVGNTRLPATPWAAASLAYSGAKAAQTAANAIDRIIAQFLGRLTSAGRRRRHRALAELPSAVRGRSAGAIIGRDRLGGGCLRAYRPSQGDDRGRLGHECPGREDKRPRGLHAQAENAVGMKGRVRRRRAVVANGRGTHGLRMMRMYRDGGRVPSGRPVVVRAGRQRDRKKQREQRLHADPGQSEPCGEC